MRYLPDAPLPPYSYVPGGSYPHPIRDPAGHSHAQTPEPPPAQSTELNAESPLYLRAVDLFNHGFYWEAHESWEALWIAAGRRGMQADFLKGLIKLAAAGVKAREGRSEGVRRHGLRAQQLFQQVLATLPTGVEGLAGLRLPTLLGHAAAVAENADALIKVSDRPVDIVMPFELHLIAASGEN